MKTEVTLNQDMIKLYYKDIYFRCNFIISVLVIIFGSTAMALYVQAGSWLVGIAIEVITLFVVYVLFAMVRNSYKIAIASLASSEKVYFFEFCEKDMKVCIHHEETIILLENIKIRRLRHMAQLKDKVNNKIYIIPNKAFDPIQWDKIYTLIKSYKKRGNKNA